MNYDFIMLHRLGVGCVLIRHSEIVEMEPTAENYTNVLLSTGNELIVQEGPADILKIIRNLEELKAQSEELVKEA